MSVLKEIAQDFCSVTTIHGLNHVAGAKSFLLKSYHLFTIISAYLDCGYYETITSKDTAAKPIFSHITFCDTSILSEYVIMRHKELQHFKDNFDKTKNILKGSAKSIHALKYVNHITPIPLISANIPTSVLKQIGR